MALIGAAGCAADCVLLAKIRKNGKTGNSKGREQIALQIRTSIDELFCNRSEVDTLDMETLLPWFQEQQKQLDTEEASYFLARISERTAQMFQLDTIPAEFDREHCLIQVVAVRREDGYAPEKIRLITFERMDNALKQSLAGRDYLVIMNTEWE